jgi:hypothetical protein
VQFVLEKRMSDTPEELTPDLGKLRTLKAKALK